MMREESLTALFIHQATIQKISYEPSNIIKEEVWSYNIDRKLVQTPE